MAQVKEFNPIETARKVEDSYREYIATTIHFADSDLQAQLESILKRPGYLQKAPSWRPHRHTGRARRLLSWWTREPYARA